MFSGKILIESVIEACRSEDPQSFEFVCTRQLSFNYLTVGKYYWNLQAHEIFGRTKKNSKLFKHMERRHSLNI